MADAPRTAQPDLHEKRFEQERLAYSIDKFLHALIPEITLPDMVQARNRLLAAGLNEGQVMKLMRAATSVDADDEPRLEDLRKWRVPIETFVEYLSAPEASAGNAIPTRESIHARVCDNLRAHGNRTLDEMVPRTLYVGAFLAAAMSPTMLGSRLASLSRQTESYVKPLNQMFDKLETMLPNLAAFLGQDALAMLAGGVVGSAIVIGAGLCASAVSRARHRTQSANLSGYLTDPSAGVAEELFGQPHHQQALARYKRLSAGQKHLLSHLSAQELRVVLTGGPRAAREILASRPVSYHQQVFSLAHDTTSSAQFLGRMMELSLPETIKAPIRKALTESPAISQAMDQLGLSLNEDRIIEKMINGLYAQAPSPKVDARAELPASPPGPATTYQALRFS